MTAHTSIEAAPQTRARRTLAAKVMSSARQHRGAPSLFDDLTAPILTRILRDVEHCADIFPGASVDGLLGLALYLEQERQPLVEQRSETIAHARQIRAAALRPR
jgi:hypothetical protein